MGAPTLKSWLEAIRLRTLPLAVSSIGMGGFLAAFYNRFQWPVFVLSVVTTIFLQILSNLANDYGDFQNGADNSARKGPSRAVQSGSIRPQTMKIAMGCMVVLSFLSGVSLIVVGIGWNVRFFLFLFLGILAIVASIKYTAGKNPYGYAGLGDISVFLFFGWLGVAGSFYLHTGFIRWDIFLPASACGLFSTAVLNINNMRDISSDQLAGKHSIPVRIGLKRAKIYHYFLLSLGVACAVLYYLRQPGSPIHYLFFLVLPLFFLNAYKIYKADSAHMDPYLKQMAIATLLFVITFGIGLLSL